VKFDPGIKMVPFFIGGWYLFSPLLKRRITNDKIDSKRIALYVYEKRETLPLNKLPGSKIDQLRSFLTLSEKLMKHRTAHKNGITDLKDCYQEGEKKY